MDEYVRMVEETAAETTFGELESGDYFGSANWGDRVYMKIHGDTNGGTEEKTNAVVMTVSSGTRRGLAVHMDDSYPVIPLVICQTMLLKKARAA